MKKNRLFKLTFLSALTASMVFSYGNSTVPLFTSHSYVSQVEAADLRSSFKSDKVYEVMELLVNYSAAHGWADPLEGITDPNYDVTKDSKFTAYRGSGLDTNLITQYTGRINLYPYQLSASDLVGLNKAMYASEVDLPNSITELPNGVFDEMTGLKTVKMSNKVTKIGVNAFRKCTSLNKIIINGKTSSKAIDISTVTSIGNSAFSGCTSIVSVDLNPNIALLDSNAFNNCSSMGGEVSLPDNVQLGTAVFYGTVLDKITFASGIKSIPNDFLSNIDSMDGIEVNLASDSKIQIIGASAFENSYIKSINIENAKASLTKIDNKAFMNAAFATEVKIDQLTNLTTVGRGAFFGTWFHMDSSYNAKVTLPESVTDIGTAAFAGANVTDVNIPAKVTTLNNGVFCDTRYLENVRVPSNSELKVIGDYAFAMDCSLPSTGFLSNASKLTTLGKYAFAFCVAPGIDSDSKRVRGLSSVTLPSNVETIGDYCFWNTSSIKTISLGNLNKLTSIAPYTFALQDISTFPNEWKVGITFEIEDGSKFTVLLSEALQKTYKLESPYTYANASQDLNVMLPAGLKVIGEHAFEYHERLKSVNSNSGTIDFRNFAALTDIKEAAFNACGYYYGSVSSIDGYNHLYLPSSLVTIGKQAFANNYGLNDVTFWPGGNLKDIGESAFANCYPEKATELAGLQTLNNFDALNKLENIGASAFKANKFLKLDRAKSPFQFPAALKVIGESAFASNSETVGVRFNSALTTIGASAFKENSKLATAEFGAAESLENLGASAFEKDSSIEQINMAKTKLKRVSKDSFSECSGLKIFYAPDCLEAIEKHAFNKCSSFTDLYFPVESSIDLFAFGDKGPNVPTLTVTSPILEKGFDVPFGQKVEFEADAFVNADVSFYRKNGDGFIPVDPYDPGDYYAMAFDAKTKKFHIIGGADAKADETTVQMRASYIFGNPGISRDVSIDIPVRIVGVVAKDVLVLQSNQKNVSIDVDTANKEIASTSTWVRGAASTSNPAKFIGYIMGNKIPTNPEKDFIATLQANIDPTTFTYGSNAEKYNLKWEVASGSQVVEILGDAKNTQPKDKNGVTLKDGYFTSVQQIRVKNMGEAVIRLVYDYKDVKTGNMMSDCINLIKINVVNPINKFDYKLKETDKPSNIELIQGSNSSIIIDSSSIVYTDKNDTSNREPANFVFYSDNPSIATVNGSGVITAQNIYANGYYDTNKKNSCNIFVRTHSGSVTKKINVVVRKSKEETVPTSLEIVGDEFLNIPGSAKTFTVKNTPALSNENVEWSISGGSATLVQNGNSAVLTPVRVGKVTITAKSKIGSVKASKVIQIVAPTSDIRFMMKSASVEVDSSYSFGFVSDLKSQKGLYRPKDNSDFVKFTIADPSVAVFVNDKGYTGTVCVNSSNLSIKGVKEGKTIVTATTECGGKTQFTFFVTKKTLKAIKINEKATVEAGKSVTLKVTKNPADSLEGYTFASSDTSVATVDAFTGKVTGVKVGTCDIIVTSDIKKVTAKCKLTVTKNTSGYVTADGKTFVDESGKKWKVASKVSNNQLKKNLMVADKSSSGKYKITKVVKKGGKIASGTVAYMGPYNKKCTKATVPNKVKIGGATFSVTTVANNAFKGCTKLKSMTIGTNVTSIGNMSFSGCTSLTTVTIKSTKLTKIGSKAFYGDKKLSKFTIKSSKLKSVGAGAFKNTSAKLKVKAPKAKVAAYTKLFKKGGAASTFKVTK